MTSRNSPYWQLRRSAESCAREYIRDTAMEWQRQHGTGSSPFCHEPGIALACQRVEWHEAGSSAVEATDYAPVFERVSNDKTEFWVRHYVRQCETYSKCISRAMMRGEVIGRKAA